MKYVTIKRVSIISAFFVFMNTFFVNCGVERPGVENMEFASVAMPHTGDETSCNECHLGQRPVNTLGFLGLNSYASFDFTYHNGHLDCVNCHNNIPNTVRIRADWARGYFMHKSTLTSCSKCHGVQAVQAHPLIAGECLQCHQSAMDSVVNKDNSFYQSMTVDVWKNASGTPRTIVYDPARDVNTAVKSPNYNPTTKIFSSWTSVAQKNHMYMDHTVTVAGLNMSTCTTCHSDTTTFKGGRFHSVLVAGSLAQPTSCSSCHNSSYDLSSPTAVSPATQAFVGPALGVVQSSNPSQFNHASAFGSADCASCHTQSNWSSARWTGGQFHRTTVSPASCIECHMPTRPGGVVGTQSMDHAASGMGECVGCHISTKNALSTKTIAGSGATLLQYSDWLGAVKTPTGVVGAETLSISTVRLTLNAGAVTGKTAAVNQPLTLNFDHTSYQTNCIQCHTSPGVAGKFHKNQTTQPTNCLTCHFTPLTGNILGYSVGKSIDHGHSTVNNKNCTSCHASPTQTVASLVFKDGLYHSKLTTQPTTCRECHSPKILDQPVQASMDHSSIGTSDCRSCHNFPGTGVLGSATNPPNWKGAVGGAPTTVSLSPPTSTTWGQLNIPHPAMVLSGISCASCHGTASYSSRIVGYDHANPPAGAKCVYCHYTGQNVVGVRVSTKTHNSTSPNRDCNASGCHSSARFPSWSTTTRAWSGGSW